MNTEFEIKDILKAVTSKGIPYPGMHLIKGYKDKETRENITNSVHGSVLRKKDAKKGWLFMPVTLKRGNEEYELQNAAIQVINEKKIIETSMVGRQGTVKELIGIKDYEITITGAMVDEDFPETAISSMHKFYNYNESIILVSALTDLFMTKDDYVVIKSIDLTAMKGTENVQLYTIKLVTEKSFNLILE